MCSQHDVTQTGSGQGTENAKQINAPSLHGLACPNCHKHDLKVLGIKGAKGKSIGIGAAFGAIGNVVASAVSQNDFSLQPIQYKCNSCGSKFESLPLTAGPEELLSAPCTVNFKRLSSFVGMAVAQHVWINGVKVGPVGNGKTLTFQTMIKHNTVFVTDQYGVAFKGDYQFEAQSGGTVEIRFKRKFV